MTVQHQPRIRHFDPTFDVFVAQDSKPAALESVDLAALSALQRSLLVIDGTVTQFLEAYLLEPVRVTRLEQSGRILDQDDPWLQTPAGSQLVDRSVVLSGRQSGQLLAYAESAIVTSRLSSAMRAALDTQAGGLGRILVASSLETRREALWYGIERPARLHAEAAKRFGGACLLRTYRIMAAGKPLMIITERFPLDVTL